MYVSPAAFLFHHLPRQLNRAPMFRREAGIMGCEVDWVEENRDDMTKLHSFDNAEACKSAHKRTKMCCTAYFNIMRFQLYYKRFFQPISALSFERVTYSGPCEAADEIKDLGDWKCETQDAVWRSLIAHCRVDTGCASTSIAKRILASLIYWCISREST